MSKNLVFYTFDPSLLLRGISNVKQPRRLLFGLNTLFVIETILFTITHKSNINTSDLDDTLLPTDFNLGYKYYRIFVDLEPFQLSFIRRCSFEEM